MNNYTWAVLLCLLHMPAPAAAQDARGVLQAASRVMGVAEMDSIRYSGRGYIGLVGQNFAPDLDWPRLELQSYTRTIDFDSMSSSEEMVMVQGDYPAEGGGGIPVRGERRHTRMLRGEHAWDSRDGEITAVPSEAESRLLDIYLTPPGFIKGALAGNPTLVTRHEYGQRVRVVSFIALDKYRINATFDDQHRMLRIQTWLPSPVAGDLYYETVFSNYREIGGIRFPTRWHRHHDFDDDSIQPNVSGGHNSFQLDTITELDVNVRRAGLVVPEAVRNAEPDPVRVETTRLGDGLWLIGGGSHNSVAIEFDDYTAVVEAPLNEARSLAVIDEVYRLVPGKPIRFIINTHHHWDHIGGLRTYVHEGATVITHAGNRPYYREVLRARPWLLEPDRYSLYPPEEWSEGYIFETVVRKYALNDRSRVVELHYVQGLDHVEGMLMAYLPGERILIQADLYSPRRRGSPPGIPTASNRTLYENIRRLGLDVDTIVPVHGRPVPMAQFVEHLGGAR